MPTDIYSSKIVKKLRKQKNGDTLALIYMELAVEALKSGGVLKYDGIEPTIEEELALLLGERVEDIRTLFLMLVGCKAAQIEGKDIVLVSLGTEVPEVRSKAVERHKYGKYKNVLLSDTDIKELKSDFPDYDKRIEELSEYIASKGDMYKNHLATLRNWAKREKQTAPGTPVKPNSFTNYEQREYAPGELEQLMNED